MIFLRLWKVNGRTEVAMLWMSEFEQLKPMSDLGTSFSTTGITAGDFEKWDSEMASFHDEQALNGDFRKKSLLRRRK